MRGLRDRVRNRLHPPPIGGIVSDAPPTFKIRMEFWGLEIANRLSLRRVTSKKSPVVVSMTTHGARIDRVHVAIESVARGSLRPRRHILWLDDPELFANLPRTVRRLRRRGLEVIAVPPGYRVHTKYFPYVESIEEHTELFASNEDDILYPKDWLAGLLQKHREHPDCVVTYRAHAVALEGDRVAPYDSWTPCTSDTPSFRYFGTTVSGQLYPPSFLNFVRRQGTAFLEVAPMQDDVWLHHLAITAGVRTVQVTPEAVLFPWVPGTQASGLFWTNVLGGQNDVQIAATYTPQDIDRMRADPA